MNVYLQARPAMQSAKIERKIRKEGHEPYPVGWPRAGKGFRWGTVTEEGYQVVSVPAYESSVPIGEVPTIVDAWVRDRISYEWEWRVLRAEPKKIARKTTCCCVAGVPAAGGSRPEGAKWTCLLCGRTWVHVLHYADGTNVIVKPRTEEQMIAGVDNEVLECCPKCGRRSDAP